tara:strand:+ start:2285 stop:2509 length:225 start_codon:yes stop_codon:yes gene_type:complete
MDELTELINKFKNKKNSNPELAKFWINYLEIKIEHFNNIINQANNTIANIDNHPELSLETIQFLYNFHTISNNT